MFVTSIELYFEIAELIDLIKSMSLKLTVFVKSGLSVEQLPCVIFPKTIGEDTLNTLKSKNFYLYKLYLLTSITKERNDNKSKPLDSVYINKNSKSNVISYEGWPSSTHCPV